MSLMSMTEVSARPKGTELIRKVPKSVEHKLRPKGAQERQIAAGIANVLEAKSPETYVDQTINALAQEGAGSRLVVSKRPESIEKVYRKIEDVRRFHQGQKLEDELAKLTKELKVEIQATGYKPTFEDVAIYGTVVFDAVTATQKLPETGVAGRAERIGQLEKKLERSSLTTAERDRLQQELAHLQADLRILLGEARELRRTWVHELSDINPDTGRQYQPEELARLRRVAASDYEQVAGKKLTIDGKEMVLGLINEAHRDAASYEDHKKAQERIFDSNDELGQRYAQAIRRGIVRPDAITAEMKLRLKVEESQPIQVESFNQLNTVISNELVRCQELGLVTEEESKNIREALDTFTSTYRKAFPDVAPQAVTSLALDNARLLVYQIDRDKQVFSGSDHGDLHILQGDFNRGLEMLTSLEEQGVKLTSSEKAVWMQAVILHDIGYTVGVAQAPASWEASKDHPIFSVSFIEANKSYFVERFGEAGYNSMIEIVLMHSYPSTEIDAKATNKDGFHQEVLNAVMAIPDALGTTFKEKSMEFFRNPMALLELTKIQLYSDLAFSKYSPEEAQWKIVAYVEQRRDKLRQIAQQDPNEERKNGYLRAIDGHFDAFTAVIQLGQHVGVLDGVRLIKTPEGKFIPDVTMHVSKVQAILASVFGDKLAVAGFTKAMKDHGFSSAQYQDLAECIRNYRQAKTPEEKKLWQQKLVIQTEKARFTFNPETSLDPEMDYSSVFLAFDQQTLRGEMRNLSEVLSDPANRTSTKIAELTQNLLQSALAKDVSVNDIIRITDIVRDLRRLPTVDEYDVSVILKKVSSLVTERELTFLEVDQI